MVWPNYSPILPTLSPDERRWWNASYAALQKRHRIESTMELADSLLGDIFRNTLSVT